MIAAIRNWAEDVWAAWDRFWFAAADAATLSLIRIFAGAMMLYTHLVWSLGLNDFYTETGWLPSAAVGLLPGREGAWSYHWLLTNPAALWTAHVIALVVFALLTLGYFTRVMSVLAFLITVSYSNRVPGALFGLDDVNAFLAMYLMLGGAGDVWSLDAWQARRRQPGRQARPRVSTNVAIRLIQLHLCVLYFFSGLGKAMGETWWNGTAVWGAVANAEYQSLDLTFLADWPLTVNVLTHITVFWELTYPALVWPRLSRPVMLVTAVGVHLGIALFLGMMTFGLVMLIANLAFVPPSMVRAALSRLRGRASA